MMSRDLRPLLFLFCWFWPHPPNKTDNLIYGHYQEHDNDCLQHPVSFLNLDFLYHQVWTLQAPKARIWESRRNLEGQRPSSVPRQGRLYRGWQGYLRSFWGQWISHPQNIPGWRAFARLRRPINVKNIKYRTLIICHKHTSLINVVTLSHLYYSLKLVIGEMKTYGDLTTLLLPYRRVYNNNSTDNNLRRRLLSVLLWWQCY